MSFDAGAFWDKIARINSTQEYAIRAAAGAWIALANAAAQESGALSGTAQQAAGQEGVGLLELADRLEAASGWADGAGAVAEQISQQLQRAGDRAARAIERAIELSEQFRALENVSVVPAVGDITPGLLAQLDAEAQRELDELGAEFAQVIGGQPPAAPGPRGGGPTAAPVAGGPTSASTASATGPAGTAAAEAAAAGAAASAASGPGGSAADYQAANGSAVGSGEYPHSRVMGPEQGDFAGWVQSPTTGHLVDPATGREFDPVAGRWIDPVTGQPFGEVTEYASRLSGLGGGPGTIASPGGLAATGPAGTAGTSGAGGGTAGLAGLYGGVLPPSLAAAGPVRQQVANQATRNMGQRARVATGLAMREAAQGGRPFVPPPASMATSAAPATGRGQARGGQDGRWHGRPTDLTEDPEVWSPRQSALHGVLGA